MFLWSFLFLFESSLVFFVCFLQKGKKQLILGCCLLKKMNMHVLSCFFSCGFPTDSAFFLGPCVMCFVAGAKKTSRSLGWTPPVGCFLGVFMFFI